MARRPRPTAIHPRVKDMRLYEAALRESFLNPMFQRLRRRLAQAEAANQAYRAMDDVVDEMVAARNAGVPVDEIQKALNRMEGYHTDRVKQTFGAALQLDISSVLSEPEVRAFMELAVENQVDLVKTIPRRMHDSLKRRLQKELQDNAFDQKRLMEMFAQEYGSSGYNLRRITRDSVNKAIGGLTEIRHRQLGIEMFTWQSSEDERVRPTHRDLDGQEFAWNDLPPEGAPGWPIQCRCVALPIVTFDDKARLQTAVRVRERPTV